MAAVELAVLLPLVLTLVIGAIDVGRAIHVRHKLVEAARTGARLYSLQSEVTEAEIDFAIDKVMSDGGLDAYSVDYSPESRAFQQFDPVTVSVSLPYHEVAWLSSRFLSDHTLRGSCTMPADTN